MKEKKVFSIRTDLVYEDAIVPNSGIEVSERTIGHDSVYSVKLKESNEQLGKKAGSYHTIVTNAIINDDDQEIEGLINTIVEVLQDLFKSIPNNKEVLVVGLGNDSITPDSLGPYVMERVMVTRHLYKLDENNKDFRSVSGIVPGVMGQTGIETSDIIVSIAKKVNPDIVIVIDALAARSIDRINKTIQITDAGINPGSGVGNSRKEISLETLGIPVIAIGVPMVVDVATLVLDSLDLVLQGLKKESISPLNPLLDRTTVKKDLDKEISLSEEEKNHFLGQIGLLDDDEKRSLIVESLSPNYNMMVTPKEVDEFVEVFSIVISEALNRTLHKAYTS